MNRFGTKCVVLMLGALGSMSSFSAEESTLSASELYPKYKGLLVAVNMDQCLEKATWNLEYCIVELAKDKNHCEAVYKKERAACLKVTPKS